MSLTLKGDNTIVNMRGTELTVMPTKDWSEAKVTASDYNSGALRTAKKFDK